MNAAADRWLEAFDREERRAQTLVSPTPRRGESEENIEDSPESFNTMSCREETRPEALLSPNVTLRRDESEEKQDEPLKKIGPDVD